MKTEKELKSGTPKKGKRRILKLVLAIVVVLIVLVFLLVPALISSGKGRKMILAKINDSIAGQTDFSDLSMGWFKGIEVADFSFNDNAGQVSVRVKQIATKPHYGSLLTGNLSFGQTLIDKPNVQINLKAQKPGSPGQEVPADTATESIVLPVKRLDLVLNDGNVRITDPKSGTVELSQINSKLNLRPPGQQTDFDLNMVVARAGRAAEIQVTSRITPGQKTGWSLKGTSGSLTIDVNGLDLESLGPIFALAGLDLEAKGFVESQVKSRIEDGRFENLSADIKAKGLEISGAKLKGDRIRTSVLDVSLKLGQKSQTINIDDLQIRTDWASLSASGAVPTTLTSLADFLEAGSNYSLTSTFDCDLARVLSQMPKTLGLKEGMQITSGRLNGNIETPTTAGRKQIQARATLAGLEGLMEGKKVALSEPVMAEAQISSDKKIISFDKLGASAPFAKVNCTGNTESLKYDVQADLAKLQSEFGQFIDIGKLEMAGEFLSKGQVSIKEDKITALNTLAVRNLRFSSAEGLSASEPTADVNFACDLDRKDSILSIATLKANTSFGQVSMKDGVVPLNKESAKPLNLVISANNVDLQKLLPFAVLFASLPKEMQLAGIAESQISVSSRENIYAIASDSTKIRNLKLTYPEQKPFDANQVLLTFETEIDPKQKAINVKKLELETPQIKIRKGEFSQLSKDGKTKLGGQVEFEYDWSAVSAVAAPYLPEGLTLEGQRQDTISFLSEYPDGQTDKLLPNLMANAKVGFERAGYMGLQFGTTDVDVQVRNGLLKIAPFSTTVNNGQFNFAAQADFTKKPALLTANEPMQIIDNINVNDETTKTLLKYLNPIFADAVNVRGIANLNCERLAIPITAAAKNHAEVVGTVSMNKLRLQSSGVLDSILSAIDTGARGADITIHPTRFVLEKGFLRYDDMQIDIGDNPVNFAGVIGLDKSLQMTVTLPYTTSGRTARSGQGSRGDRIPLPLKGTVDKPQLDVGKLLEQQLKKQLEDQLRKGLEGLFK